MSFLVFWPLVDFVQPPIKLKGLIFLKGKSQKYLLHLFLGNDLKIIFWTFVIYVIQTKMLLCNCLILRKSLFHFVSHFIFISLVDTFIILKYIQ